MYLLKKKKKHKQKFNKRKTIIYILKMLFYNDFKTLFKNIYIFIQLRNLLLIEKINVYCK